jgi:hypothetical protein
MLSGNVILKNTEKTLSEGEFRVPSTLIAGVLRRGMVLVVPGSSP